MLVHPLAQRQRGMLHRAATAASAPTLVRIRQRRNIRRRRRRRRAEDAIENPGAAQHRRRAIRVGGQHQDRPLTQQTVALRVGQCDLAELTTLHALDAVQLGERLIEVRVVGCEQVRDRLIAPQDAIEEQA